jgi:hypothetical protein
MNKFLDKLQYQTVSRRVKIDSVLRLLDFRRNRSRRGAATVLGRVEGVDVSQFKREGLMALPIGNFEKTVLHVIEYCEKIYKESATFENKTKKNYLRAIYKDLDFEPSSPILELAFHKEIVSIVARCINDFPVLANIALYYSPPSNGETELQFEGSQLFHMDEEDNTLCKLWLLIDNVSESDGPTVIIKKDRSSEIASKLRYKKGQKISSDDKLLKNILDSDLLSITGSKGDIFLLDTAGVFHYGSRVSGDSKGRYMLMISYSTSFNLDHGLFGRSSRLKSLDILKVKTDLNSQQRKMLVDGSAY